MSVPPSRRQFLVGSGALIATLGTGCRSSNTSTPPAAGSSSSGPPLAQPSGTLFPEMTPKPEPADLEGGPQWTVPDLSGKEMTLWGLNYAPHVDRYKVLAKKFEQLTGAKVKVQPQDDVPKQMLTAIAGNNTPDVVCLMGKMSEHLVKQKALRDLADVVYGDLKIDMGKWWAPDSIQSYQWGDAYYGVPVESGQVGYTVAGRTDLIGKASADVQSLWPGSLPESGWDSKGAYFNSYDEVFELGKALQQKKGDKVSIWGVNRQGWQLESLSTLIWQQDVNWWDGESRTFNLDNEACVKAIETMITTPFKLGIESNLAGGNVVNNFLAGQVALGIGNGGIPGPAALVKISSEHVLAPSIVAGKAPPVFMSEGGWGFEVPVQAKNQDVAIEFARFMTTYDAQFIYSQIYGGIPPACAALVNSEIYAGDDPIKRGIRRVMTALPRFTFYGHGRDPQSGDIAGAVFGSVRSGKLTAAQASKELQEKLTAQQARFS